jgi:hypothetical protein
MQHIFRRLGHAPMFTTMALVTLTLGIGANTAVFSVVNSVLLKPLPYPQAESLVGVWHAAPGVTGVGDSINCSPTMYFTHREENRTFQEIGLWSTGGASVTGLAEPGNNSLLAALTSKGLPERETKAPVEGLLYFAVEGKVKLKDLSLIYKSPFGRLEMEFK